MASYKVQYGDTLSKIAKQYGTSVEAILASNPNIKDRNKIYAGSSLNVGTTTPPVAGNSTPTPQPTTTQTTVPKAQTIEERAQSIIPDGMDEDSYTSNYYKELASGLNKPIDEKALRNEARKRLNTQFDALRLAASQKIAEERRLGEGRLGSSRAIDARSGTIGSTFQQANENQINRDTQDIVNSINAETEAKIAFLMGESEKDISAQIAEQREAKKKGAEEYINYLSTRDSQRVERANNLAKLFAAQGVDVSNLTEADIKKLEDTYGVDLATFKNMIETSKNEVDKDQFFELGKNESLVRYNPTTGKLERLGGGTGGGGGSGSGGSGGGGGGGGGGAYSSDLAAVISNVAAGIGSLNQRNAFKSAIASARNDQDKIATIASVLKISGPAREDLTQTAVGQNSLRQAISLLKSGVQTGKLQAGSNYLFNLTGNQVDPQLTQLKQYIVSAIQPYRSSVTGAAWGAQEENEYKSMFGSIGDTPETLLTKLQNLDRIMTNKRVGIISSYADPLGAYNTFGDYYDQTSVPQAQKQTSSTGQSVRMMGPDGKTKNVPLASVAQAKKVGYKEIKQ